MQNQKEHNNNDNSNASLGKIKILYSGGGTLGPVTPLLALHEIFTQSDFDIDPIWVGTKWSRKRNSTK